MKQLLTAMFFFITSVTSAQIVNIPDPVFKQALINSPNFVDLNADGEIQESEALAKTSLQFYGGQLFQDMTGIQAFQNLQSLGIEDQQNLTHLDLSNMTSLKIVIAQGNDNIDTLNLSGCVNIESLSILYGAPHNLVIDTWPRLKYLGLSGTNIRSLDLRASDSLAALHFEGINLRKLDVSGLTKLQNIFASSVSLIDTLLAPYCTSLHKLDLNSYNQHSFYYANLAGCFHLDTLMMYGATIDSLDLSDAVNLKYLYLSGPSGPNPVPIEYLNIKNGSQLQTFIINAANTVPLLRVCVDDFEMSAVQQQLSGFTMPLLISPLCSFAGGGNYNTITGKIRLDLDMNGCDVADNGMPDVPIQVTDGTGNSIIRYTSPSGYYAHYPYTGSFTLHPYFPYPYFYVTPVSTNVVFDTANSIIDTADFCIEPNGIHNSLDITFLPLGAAIPGFTTAYRMLYRNRGTTTLSGNVELNFDNSRMSLLYSYPLNSSQSGGQLTWNYTNLQPFEDRHIDINFSLISPPTNQVGDTLTYLATINPVNGDETPADNSFILPQRVIGSFDPNDKLCLEGDKLDISSIGDKLHYIVHFQNMGTDSAYNIVITDTLTNNLDWESFDFLTSSHPCHVKRTGNKLEFYFENIRLPYQAINDAGSNGFVAFEIKPKNTLSIGDSINNTASIYFDFNLPVQTNKTITIISPSVIVPVKLEYFSLSSKEQSNLLTWKITTTDLSTTFNVQRSNDGIHFNDIGNITATAQRCQLPFNFTDDKPLTGKNYYRIKITDANGVSFYSKILVTGNTKSGFAINAVVSNQNNTTLYVDVSKDQTIQIKIIAADGRLLYNESKSITAGTNQLDLQTGNLSKGIYTLVVYTNDGELITKRFIK